MASPASSAAHSAPDPGELQRGLRGPRSRTHPRAPASADPARAPVGEHDDATSAGLGGAGALRAVGDRAEGAHAPQQQLRRGDTTELSGGAGAAIGARFDVIVPTTEYAPIEATAAGPASVGGDRGAEDARVVVRPTVSTAVAGAAASLVGPGPRAAEAAVPDAVGADAQADPPGASALARGESLASSPARSPLRKVATEPRGGATDLRRAVALSTQLDQWADPASAERGAPIAAPPPQVAPPPTMRWNSVAGGGAGGSTPFSERRLLSHLLQLEPADAPPVAVPSPAQPSPLSRYPSAHSLPHAHARAHPGSPARSPAHPQRTANRSPSGDSDGGSGARAAASPLNWLKYAASSAPGRSRHGDFKQNQDGFFAAPHLGEMPNVHLFGVCDGHGPHGHHASRFVADTLPSTLAQLLLAEVEACDLREHAFASLHAVALPGAAGSSAPAPRQARSSPPASEQRGSATPTTQQSSSSSASSSASSHAVADPAPRTAPRTELPASAFTVVARAFRTAIDSVQARMFAQPGTYDLSGTTLVCVLLVGAHAMVANVGDSRCILACTRGTDDAPDAAPEPGSRDRGHSGTDATSTSHASGERGGGGDAKVGADAPLDAQLAAAATAATPSDAAGLPPGWRLYDATQPRASGAAAGSDTGGDAAVDGARSSGGGGGGSHITAASRVSAGSSRSSHDGETRAISGSLSRDGGAASPPMPGSPREPAGADLGCASPSTPGDQQRATLTLAPETQRALDALSACRSNTSSPYHSRRSSVDEASIASLTSPAAVRIVALRLSTDHKPADPAEQARVAKHGGVISHARRPGAGGAAGPLRVWNPLLGARSPGLAMTRSVGDRIVTAAGVICKPTLTYHLLRPGVDRAIVIASDGVWDVLSSRDAARVAALTRPVALAAEQISTAARDAWELIREEAGGDCATDDVTVAVLQLWSGVMW